MWVESSDDKYCSKLEILLISVTIGPYLCFNNNLLRICTNSVPYKWYNPILLDMATDFLKLSDILWKLCTFSALGSPCTHRSYSNRAQQPSDTQFCNEEWSTPCPTSLSILPQYLHVPVLHSNVKTSDVCRLSAVTLTRLQVCIHPNWSWRNLG